MANAYFYSNTAIQTTLSGSISSGATSITVGAATGFPGSFPYILALDYGSATEELVSVTNAAGTTLTVSRGFGGTSAQSHSLGAVVRHVYNSVDATDFRTHEAATSDAHGVTGALVGATMAQTLTNKTLTSPTINGATLSGTFAGAHTYSGAVTMSGGGTLSGTFTGTPTLSGAVVLSGGPNISNGGALAGTFTGSPTLSGSPVFSGDAIFQRSVSTDAAWQNQVSGDGTPRLTADAAGKLSWGPGNAAVDTNLYRSAANTLKTDDSLIVTGNLSVTGDLSVTGIGQTRYVKKTADESVTSSTTLQNDDALVVSLAANAEYELTLYLAVNGSAAGDVKTAWSMPASTTGQRFEFGPDTSSATSSAGTAVRASCLTDGFATEINYGTFATGQQSFIMEVLYITTAGTSGNAQLQWAQNASSATATTVEAGSYLKITRVA